MLLTLHFGKHYLKQAILITSNTSFGLYRCLHIVPPQQSNAHRKTRFEMICELNKTLYIHRNAEFGPQPIFYRGPKGLKKIDLYQQHLDKQKAFREWKTYSRQIQTGEAPVDDVYLASLYKAPSYSVGEAVKILKENIRLDFTDPESPIRLRLQLEEIMRKLRKKKRPVMFFKTASLPHPSGLRNKICLFTGDEAIATAALSEGACAAGMSDTTTQVLNGSLVCDAFYATADCLAELSNHADLKRLLGNHIPNKRFNLVSEARELHDPIHETIIHNHVNLKQCNVIIGVPRQSADELEENIRKVIDVVHEVAIENRADKIIESATLSCFTEPLAIDSSDILHDDV